jgi:hypothetical protein
VTAAEPGGAVLPELTVSNCEEAGHAGHFARITAGYPWHSASFCLLAEQASFLSNALAGAMADPLALLDHETRLTWDAGLPGERERIAKVRAAAGLEALT